MLALEGAALLAVEGGFGSSAADGEWLRRELLMAMPQLVGHL